MLWQVRGGIQKITLFGKRPSPYYGKNGSNKKRETTVHHYFKTWRSINPQHFKNFLQVQLQKPSSAMMKLALMRTSTGKEDPVTSVAEDKSIRVTSLRNCIPNKCFTEFTRISTSTVQRRLRESSIHGRIAVKETLLKDTKKKKRLAWAKKHEQWTLDLWKSVLWSDESKFEICKTQSRWTDDLRMCDSHCEVWRRRRDGVGVLCW